MTDIVITRFIPLAEPVDSVDRIPAGVLDALPKHGDEHPHLPELLVRRVEAVWRLIPIGWFRSCQKVAGFNVVYGQPVPAKEATARDISDRLYRVAADLSIIAAELQ